MSNISGPTAQTSTGDRLQRGSQKLAEAGSNTDTQVVPSPTARQNLIGYAYLCVERQLSQKQTTAFTDSSHKYDRLAGVLRDATSGDSKIVGGDQLIKILAQNNIPAALWNSVIQTLPQKGDVAKILPDANRAGTALAIGLPADASWTFIHTELNFQGDNFAQQQKAHIFDSMRTEVRSAWKDPKSRILLHELTTNRTQDIPAEGFAEYRTSFGWAAKAAGMKLFANLISKPWDMITGSKTPSIATANMMTWKEPVAASVRSPAIRELIKVLNDDGIDVELAAIPDNKGFLLQFRYFVSEQQKAKLQAEVDRLRLDQGNIHKPL